MVKPNVFTSWVNLYTKDMLSWATYKISDKSTAEDIVQDTFLVAAERLEQFRNDSNPKTWLFGILNNKIAEYYRSKSKHIKVDLGTDRTLDEFFDENGHWKKEMIGQQWQMDETNLFDNPQFIESFQLCLGKLPAEWNICISQKYLKEKDAQDICQELGITATNYWQILHRAKLQLRRCLEKHWFKNNRALDNE